MGQKLTTPTLRTEVEAFRGVSLDVCDAVLDSWYACAEGYFLSRSECFAIIRRSGLQDIVDARLFEGVSPRREKSSHSIVGRSLDDDKLGYWTRTDLLSRGHIVDATEKCILALFDALKSPRGKMDILHLLVPLIIFAEAERVERIKMIFKVFDVTGNEKLTWFELVHAFKTSVVGLVLWEAQASAESSSMPDPDDLEVAALSMQAYSDLDKDHLVLEGDLIRFSQHAPDVKSWLDAYDELLARFTAPRFHQNSEDLVSEYHDRSLFLKRKLRSLHERPPKRKLHASFSYISDARTLVMFGGYSTVTQIDSGLPATTSSVTGDVVLYRLRPALLERVRPLGESPPPRAAHSHCSIQGCASNGILYFGGVGRDETALNDLWLLWYTFSDDDNIVTNDNTLVFGESGIDNRNASCFAWHQIEIKGGNVPTPRRHACMVQASARVVVLYGGMNDGIIKTDVHVLQSLDDSWATATWQVVNVHNGGDSQHPPPLYRPVIFRTIDQTASFPVGTITVAVFGGTKHAKKVVSNAGNKNDDTKESNHMIWTMCLVEDSTSPLDISTSVSSLSQDDGAKSSSAAPPPTFIPTGQSLTLRWISSDVEGPAPAQREGAAVTQPVGIEFPDESFQANFSLISPMSPSPQSPTTTRSPMPLSPLRSSVGGGARSPLCRQKSTSTRKRANEGLRAIMRQKTAALEETKVWIFGGFDPLNKCYYSDMWELSCRAGQWTSSQVFNGRGDSIQPKPFVTNLSIFTGPRYDSLVVLHEPRGSQALSTAMTPWVFDNCSSVLRLENFAPRIAMDARLIEKAGAVLFGDEKKENLPIVSKVAEWNPILPAEAQVVNETELAFVYGWSSRGLRRRDTVRYNAIEGTAEIIYPAASCCVVLSKVWKILQGKRLKNGKFRELDDDDLKKYVSSGGKPIFKSSLSLSQRHFLAHDGDVVAVATSPRNSIVATAQENPRGRIILWNAVKLQCCGVIKDKEVNNVRHLSFSPEDGSKLLVLSAPAPVAPFFVSIYDPKNCRILFMAPLSSSIHRIADVGVISWINERAFASCVGDEVTLWKDSTLNLGEIYFESQVMMYGNAYKSADQCCVAALPLDDMKDTSIEYANAYERSCATDRAVTGSTNGCLYVWAGSFCKDVVQAHDGSVVAISFIFDKSLLVSSGTDRFVRLWAPDLGCLGEILMDGVVCSIDAAHASAIYSKGITHDAKEVPQDSGTMMLLLASSDGSIQERRVDSGDDPNGRPLVVSHSAGGVNAMDVNQKKKQVVTVGDDAMLYVWNSQSMALPWRKKLSIPSHVCRFTPKGDRILVGLGTWRNGIEASIATNRTFEYQDTGTIWMLNNREELDKIMNLKVGTSPISAIALSPIDNIAIVGLWNEYLDNHAAEENRADKASIVLYDNTHDKNGWTDKRIAKGVSTGIFACDISSDGKFVRSTTSCGEEFILEIPTLEPKHSNIIAMDRLLEPTLVEAEEGEAEGEEKHKDKKEQVEEEPIIEWTTQNSFGGFHMRSTRINPINSNSREFVTSLLQQNDNDRELTEVDTVTVATQSCSAIEGHETDGIPDLIATGHRSGALRVWRSPCDCVGVRSVRCDAFSSPLTSVDFLRAEGNVEVLGGACHMGCVIQWLTLPLPDFTYNDGATIKHKSHNTSITDPASRPGERITWVAEPTSADRESVIEVDAKLKDLDPEFFYPPECSLSLKYVHGFCPGFPRVNGGHIICTAEDRLAYSVAAVIVLMDTRRQMTNKSVSTAKRQNEQAFFQGHDKDVSAMALHPNGTIIASGQAGTDPTLCVWETKTSSSWPRTLRKLHLSNQIDIVSLSFAASGDILATASAGDNRAVTIIDWRNNWVQHKVAAGAFAVQNLKFILDDKPMRLRLFQFGDQHFGVWTLSGGKMTYQNGLFALRKTAGEEEYEEEQREAERKVIAEEQQRIEEEEERRRIYGDMEVDNEDTQRFDADDTDDESHSLSDEDEDDVVKKSVEEVELKCMQSEEDAQRALECKIAEFKAEAEAKRIAEIARLEAKKNARLAAQLRAERKIKELATQQIILCGDIFSVPSGGDDQKLVKRALLGSSDGWLHLVDLERVKVIQSIPALTGNKAVNVIMADNAGKATGGFFTSGNDGILRRWSGFDWQNVLVDPIQNRYEMQAKGEVTEEYLLSSIVGIDSGNANEELTFDLPPRASDLSNLVCLRAIGYRNSGRLVIGTHDGRIIQLNYISSTDELLHTTEVEKSGAPQYFDDTTTPVVTHTMLHLHGATSAIAMDPLQSRFCSLGYGDQTVQLWDLSTNKIISSLNLAEKVGLSHDVHPTSCCFSSDGQLLIIGLATTCELSQSIVEPISSKLSADQEDDADIAVAPDDFIDPTHAMENSSAESSSSFTRSRTNTFVSDDDDRSETSSNNGDEGNDGGNSDISGSGNNTANRDVDDENPSLASERDRPAFIVIAISEDLTSTEVASEEDPSARDKDSALIEKKVSMRLLQSPVIKATQLALPCATKEVLLSPNGHFLAISSKTNETWRRNLDGIHICGVSVVDECGANGRNPARKVPGTDLAGNMKHASSRALDVTETVHDNSTRKIDDEASLGREEDDSYARADSELTELQIERLGHIPLSPDTESIISMDFSEDAQFLRFAASHVNEKKKGVYIEGTKSLETGKASSLGIGASGEKDGIGCDGGGCSDEIGGGNEESEQDADEFITSRSTVMNFVRLATLELIVPENTIETTALTSAIWAGEACAHDALLSAPFSGRSAWLPKEYVSSPACTVSCPGVVAMGVRVRVSAKSSAGVIDEAEAGLRLFRKPCFSTIKASSLKVHEHGQSLRIYSMGYSEPAECLVSVVSPASWCKTPSSTDNSTCDSAVFVWKFEDHRIYNEEEEAVPLKLEHGRTPDEAVLRVYDIIEDMEDSTIMFHAEDPPLTDITHFDAAAVSLEGIYGLSVRHNGCIQYGTGRELSYTTSGGVLVCNRWNAQAMIIGRMDAVVGLTAVSADGKILAIEARQVSSGQSVVFVYPRNASIQRGKLSGPPLSSYLKYLAFSAEGDKLMAMEDDELYTVNIYESLDGTLWASSELIVRVPSLAPAKPMFLVHQPLFASAYGSTDFITGGADYICLWSLSGSTKKIVRNVFGFDEKVVDDILHQQLPEDQKPKTGVKKPLKSRQKSRSQEPESPKKQEEELRRLLCAATYRGGIVTGSESGHLLVWRGDPREGNEVSVRLDEGIKGHRAAVVALTARDNFSQTEIRKNIELPLVSASRDGEIKLWRFPDLILLRTIVLVDAIVGGLQSKDGACATISSLALNSLGNRLIASTFKGIAYEVNIWNGIATPVLAGHVGDEMWGLSAHPKDPAVAVSCGKEGSLCRWSLVDHCLDQRLDLGRSAHCCRYAPAGDRVAVGCFDGSVLIVADENFVIKQTMKAKASTAMRVTDLAWAEDGTWLVASNMDESIIVYRSQQESSDQKLAAVTTIKQGVISFRPLHVDISADAKILRCCSAEGSKSAFFKTWGGKRVENIDVNTKWAFGCACCPSAFELKDFRHFCSTFNGAKCHIHVVACSRNGQHIAFGDALGNVHLFTEILPSSSAERNIKESNGRGASRRFAYQYFKAHACHVTALEFNSDATRLLTGGSPDLCVKQWAINPTAKDSD